mmetsp:Transcript_1038/g.2711  ORF Transcript_1038/g.2711 Transcript_1038/m.2711 type:complete len:264 (-) Transcript_1038:266-1057(-)
MRSRLLASSHSVRSARHPCACTPGMPACVRMHATTALIPPSAATLAWLSAFWTLRLLRALQPCSWTPSASSCTFIPASTTSIPKSSAALTRLLSLLSQRLHSAELPATCTPAASACARIPASRASSPPSSAILSLVVSLAVARLPSARNACSCTPGAKACARIPASTVSMIPLSASSPQESNMCSRGSTRSAFVILASALHPASCTSSAPTCPRRAATTAFIPPLETFNLVAALKQRYHSASHPASCTPASIILWFIWRTIST